MNVFIDDQRFDVLAYYQRHGHAELPATPTTNAAELLACVGKDGSYRVFLEGRDGEADTGPYPLSRAIPLVDGMRFYSVPPAAVGG